MDKVLTKSIPSKGSFSLNKRETTNIIMCVFGFFLGRVWFFNFFNPIAIGYISVFLFRNFRFVLISFFVGLGIFTSNSVSIVKYILCISMLLFCNFVIKKQKLTVAALLAGISVSLSGILVSLANGFNLYNIIISLLEGVFTFCIAFILKKGVNVLEGNVSKRLLSGEEIISISIIFGSIIAGASKVYFWYFSFSEFFTTLVILVIGYKGGVTLGALSGILIGLMLTLSGQCGNNIIGILSVSGMVSGVYFNKNKFITIILFIISRASITFLIDPSQITKELIFSVLVASVCFLAIKDKIYFNFLGFLNNYSAMEDDYIVKVREVTTTRLESFSKAFYKLAITFRGISEKKTTLEQKDISLIIDDVAAKVCTGCKFSQKCWKDEFFNTYQAVYNILNAFEEKGKVEIDDIPVEFLKTCVNIAYFIETSSKIFELHKLNLIWQNKIIESKDLISQQFLGISGIIKELSEELNTEMRFKEDVEQKLLAEFNLNNLSVDDVIVYETYMGRFEIFINFSECINKNKCIKDIVPIVNRTVGRKMKTEEVDCEKCKVKIIEEERFNVTASVSKAIKDNSKVSGDSYSFLNLKNGENLLALSDGMGSGFRANEESSAAIELLEEFIESGFKKDLAVKMINSVLVLKSSDDSFSTLDICTIDNYTGRAEFVKIGAAPTFLIRDKKVQTIKSTTLPMGILNNVDIEMIVKKLKDNDIIVMVTDGLLEIDGNPHDKEDWIMEALKEIKSVNPEEIAERLLSIAREKSLNIIKDDMTILVARVWEKI